MDSSSQFYLHRNSLFPPGIALLISICLFASGCTTTLSVPLPGSGPAPQSSGVHVGDHVLVQTKSGQNFDFKVTAVEADALVGAKVRVKYDDMTGLQIRRVDKGSTVLTTVTVILAAAVVGAVILLAHAGPGMTGG